MEKDKICNTFWSELDIKNSLIDSNITKFQQTFDNLGVTLQGARRKQYMANMIQLPHINGLEIVEEGVTTWYINRGGRIESYARICPALWDANCPRFTPNS